MKLLDIRRDELPWPAVHPVESQPAGSGYNGYLPIGVERKQHLNGPSITLMATRDNHDVVINPSNSIRLQV